LTQEELGWSLFDKIKEIQPRKRYMPLIGEIAHSDEFGNYLDHAKKWIHNPKVQNLAKDAEFFMKDL